MKKYCAEITFGSDSILEKQRHQIYIDAIDFEHARYIAFKINPELKITGELVVEVDTETGKSTYHDYHLN